MQDQSRLIREDSRWFGGANAKVKVVEFADFLCPACALFEPVAKEIRSIYGDKIQYVFRHFPLTDVNPFSQIAAEAAECFGEQGKFFEAVELFYKNRKNLSIGTFKQFVEELGLDEQKFTSCLGSGLMTKKVSRDKEDVEVLGVKGTPTIFIGGKVIEPFYPLEPVSIFSTFELWGGDKVIEGFYPLEQVKRWVDEALIAKGEIPRIGSKELFERQQKGEKIIVLDVREKNEYEEEHIPDALHFPKSKFDKKNLELMKFLEGIPKKQMIVTYCGAGHRSGWLAINLRKIGYTNVWNLDGISFWNSYGLPLIVGPKLPPELEPVRIRTEEAYYIFTSFSDVLFVDIRDVEEYEQAHIKGAVNIPLAEIEDRLDELHRDKEIVLYCSGTFGGGTCSASLSAGRILIANGFKFGNIKVYEDGFGSWEQAGYPISKGNQP